MNRNQFEDLLANPITMNADMIADKSDRTLLWGYTKSHNSFHVYLYNGVLYCYVYDYQNNPVDIMVDEIPMRDLFPDKRLYPEACDYEFCSLLKRYGVNLPFTTFRDNRPVEKYYGDIASTLVFHLLY
jgi:hypothetical protein